jgi:sugar phosphate isomerase/epimerase
MTVLGTPYRLGSTSYIWPDGILHNVRQLGPLVDDVELVLFEVEGHSNLLDAAAVADLIVLAEAHDLTFTVHLPLDLAPAQPSSLEMAEKVIACTRDLEPWAYVLHLDGRAVEGSATATTVARWRQDACRVLEVVAGLAGDAQRLCVENLENYRPEHFLPLLERVPVGLCVDVGHLWLTGRDPLLFLDTYLRWTRVIHLHGIRDCGTEPRDHQSLLHQGTDQVAPVLNLLAVRCYSGVLTLEVFGRKDFFPSRSLVAEVVNGKR